jgi:hypothetical protein
MPSQEMSIRIRPGGRGCAAGTIVVVCDETDRLSELVKGSSA